MLSQLLHFPYAPPSSSADVGGVSIHSKTNMKYWNDDEEATSKQANVRFNERIMIFFISSRFICMLTVSILLFLFHSLSSWSEFCLKNQQQKFLIYIFVEHTWKQSWVVNDDDREPPTSIFTCWMGDKEWKINFHHHHRWVHICLARQLKQKIVLNVKIDRYYDLTKQKRRGTCKMNWVASVSPPPLLLIWTT